MQAEAPAAEESAKTEETPAAEAPKTEDAPKAEEAAPATEEPAKETYVVQFDWVFASLMLMLLQ